MLNDIPDIELNKFLHAACSSFYALSTTKDCKEFDDDLFFSLWKKLLNITKMSFVSVDNYDDYINRVMNQPIGYLAEALIAFMWAKNEGKQVEYPDTYTPYFDSLIDRTDRAALTVLANRLYYMFHFLPQWTIKKIIPLFNWKSDSGRATHY